MTRKTQSKHMPASKEFQNQRDMAIYEIINLLIEKGYTASAAHDKLHYLTGLHQESIRSIRFDIQKKLSDAS